MHKNSWLPLVVSINLLALAVLSGCSSLPPVKDLAVRVEGESFSKEENGWVIPLDDRPGTSGGKTFRAWDLDGHALEWTVDVPEDGMYAVVFRVASGRDWVVYRDFKIDGKYPSKEFESFALPQTGGFGKKISEWQSFYPVNADGKPSQVLLRRGKHIIRMTNLGADHDGDGASNLDYIELLSGAMIQKNLTGATALVSRKPARPSPSPAPTTGAPAGAAPAAAPATVPAAK